MRHFQLILCALLLTGMLRAQTELPASKPHRGSVTRFVTLPGSVKPLQQVTLFAKTSGFVKKINFDKGDTVKAGDLIAELEAPELEVELTKHEAESAALKPALEFAQQEYDRLIKAQKSSPDLILPQQLEKAKSELDKAKAAFTIVEASAKQASAMLAYTKLTAPFAGIITQRSVDLGAYVAANTVPVVTLMDFKTVRAQIAVPEVDAAFVAKGQQMVVSVEGLAGKAFKGTVTRFSYALDTATRTMLVESELPNDALELRPGMYATIKVGVQTHDNTLLIPVEGLVMEKANAFAFTFADGKAKKNPLTIGFNDGVNVEVLTGIDEAAQVLQPGKVTLNPDQSVKLKP
jgi:membrane fusion protein (multidrug efflux system)